ncbi:MAG: hypothetical protein LBT49_04455 [Prevotellaceae bacterium]|jgi:Leucine-rich repeat (LRR) protein|nr:hypothetical protein [Prevotellaceae bacterium]
MNKKIIPISLLFACGGWLLAGCSKSGNAPSITAGVQILEMPATGGETSVAISANTPWTVAGNDWITAMKTDDRTVKLQVSPNRQAARSASIVCVAGGARAAITVSQQETVTPVQSDSLALAAIYRAAGGDKWTRRWFLSQSLFQWAGVTIDNNRRVVGLNLSGNNLSGTLPEDWRFLDKLQYCLLNNNQLTGTIPDGVNQLTGLEILDLSNNSFTGNIPHMGSLTGLRMLDLSENNFTAAVLPVFFTGLTGLEDLRLKQTNLTGALPAGLQALTRLHTLDLSNNSFTGGIPDWAALVNLRVFYIYHSSLSGSIPGFIAHLPALEWLALDHNNLTGAIPDGSYAMLEKLWLNNNSLTGTIPSVLKASPKWKSFHVCSGNSFTDCSGDDASLAAIAKQRVIVWSPTRRERTNTAVFGVPRVVREQTLQCSESHASWENKHCSVRGGVYLIYIPIYIGMQSGWKNGKKGGRGPIRMIYSTRRSSETRCSINQAHT